MQFPRLRTDIELIPVKSQGERYICFRDPQGFNSGLVFMSWETLDIIRFFDGTHAIVDIQAAWMQETGQMVFGDDIQRVIDQLDEHGLLDSPQFQARKQQIEHEFISAPVRKAAHADGSYPADPTLLRQRLDEFFRVDGAAGLPEFETPSNDIKGIVAPHIDLRVGGACYSWAYKELAERSAAETFIILGTSHYGYGDLFVPTRKDFETPFGVMKTDRAFLDLLEKNYGGPVGTEEMMHRIEHSIEFQVVFLQYLFQDRRPVQIVPILVTSFHDMLLKKTSPLDDPRVGTFVQALQQTIRQYEKGTCFVVGADLAHVGRKFGDAFAAQDVLPRVEREDQEMLRAVEAVDAEGFFRSVSKDDDARKICGYPPIYTFLASTEATSGRLLKYEQWSEEPTQSAVTYASMAFY